MTTTSVSYNEIFRYYLIIINIVSFLLYGLDKFLAKHDMYRIPEKVLLGVSLIGGSYGGLLGMHIFHHKTKKPIFNVINILGVIVYSYLLFVKFK